LAFNRFIEEHQLLKSLSQLFSRKEFLLHTWLFGESLSPRVQTSIAEHLVPFESKERGSTVAALDERFIYIIERGVVARFLDGRLVEHLEAGIFLVRTWRYLPMPISPSC